MKRKPKKPVHSRLIRKWDGTELVPELPPIPADEAPAEFEVVSEDRKPLNPHTSTLEDLFAGEEETIEQER